MSWLIRSERPADVAAIHALTADAFRDAPHSSHTEQYIVDALRQAGALMISLVAEQAGEVIGHIALSPVQISDGSTDWYGLGPISVLPARQRNGIGAALMQAGIAALKPLGAVGCVVLGDPAYYGRFGFRLDPDLVLEGVPAEYFQTLAFGSARARGVVTYHATFGAEARSAGR